MTEGKYGEPPEDYVLFQAAKYLNVPVPSLADVPIWWIHKALNYMNAEGEAQAILNGK